MVNNLDFRFLYQTFIPVIYPTWSWYIISCMYCWILLAGMFLRLFVSKFMTDIDLYIFVVSKDLVFPPHQNPYYLQSSLS